MFRSSPPPATPPTPARSASASATVEAPAPARRFTDGAPARPTTFGPGIQVRGAVSGADSIEVAGRVEGSIEVDGFCHVAAGACVVGPVRAGDAVIEGEVQGRVTVRGRVELCASARVRGDIEARTVALADGCFFDGHIHMPGREGPAAATTFREKRKPKSTPLPPQRG
jgi:cytoskeletal protein CcmA (bactofilin family)